MHTGSKFGNCCLPRSQRGNPRNLLGHRCRLNGSSPQVTVLRGDSYSTTGVSRPVCTLCGVDSTLRMHRRTSERRQERAAKRADFFFEGRRIVCELKNLETDTSGKLQKILEPLKRRGEWPLFYGLHPLSRILGEFPERAEIEQQVFESTTSAVRKAVADANRQIRATKATYQLPDSGGLLVIANESIGILSPDVIATMVNRTLQKRTPEGGQQFEHINTVWVISEKHVIKLPSGVSGVSSLLLRHRVSDPMNVEDFVESLQPRWAAFHGVAYHEIANIDVAELRFENNPAAVAISPHRPQRIVIS